MHLFRLSVSVGKCTQVSATQIEAFKLFRKLRNKLCTSREIKNYRGFAAVCSHCTEPCTRSGRQRQASASQTIAIIIFYGTRTKR